MDIKRNFYFVILALACTLGLLHYYGDGLETGARNFYREEICQCDTARYQILYDSLGIPMVDYHSVIGFYVGVQRNATVVAKTALDEYYPPAFQGDEQKEGLFMNCVVWLVDNAKSYPCPDTLCDSMTLLEYDYPSYFEIQPPWRSAMTQGKALEVMINAYELTRDEKYLVSAKKFLNSFFVSTKDGGVTYKTEDQGWWYEEYAHANGKNPRVLNGMMYALISISKYYKYTGDSIGQFLFLQGIKALKHNLPEYDVNGYSNYDALGNAATPGYHFVHVDLLERLNKVAPDPVLKKYHDLWIEFREPSYLISRLGNMNKTASLLFVVLLSCFFALIRIALRKSKF